MDTLQVLLQRGAGDSLHKINFFNNLNFVKMKNFNELGVQEMDAKEMKSVDGGGIWGLLGWVVTTMAVCSVDDPEGFQEGYDSVRKNYY